MKKSLKKYNKRSYNKSTRNKLNGDILGKFKPKINNKFYSSIKDDLNKIQDDYENFAKKIESYNKQYFIEEESKQDKIYNESPKYRHSQYSQNKNYNNLRLFMNRVTKLNDSDEDIYEFRRGYNLIPNNFNRENKKKRLENKKSKMTISTDSKIYQNALERKYEKLKKEKEREKNILNNKI